MIHNKKILIIDDDKALSQSLEIGLTRQGARVLTAGNGQTGLQKFYEHQPDLVILDLRMPEMDGWEACRLIRLVSNVPIIMLTSANQEHEVVRGLRRGADDYVTKPFSPEVLLARIESLLRRAESQAPQPTGQPYDDGYLYIDLEQRLVKKASERVKLSTVEFRLLSYLFEHSGRPLANDAILTHVWGWESQQSVEYVHVYVSRLRTKLEKDPRAPQYLLTEYGFGYGFYRLRNTG